MPSLGKHGGWVDTPSLIPGMSALGLNACRLGLPLLTWAYLFTLHCNIYVFFHVPASSRNAKI